ncbi:hypothetical protein [Bradyrhizobium valentinum]|uniref:Uncharacterized protein n=1 Tax=Bradyrhizobium valentinum TaxID=1518501 RepID=A0A0R3LYV4_9BRAD|nr:hypothetical protein [Bradyrhizobium valentinum]KRR10805.1 hypothetical protein CP49_22045 [Bradyrhizobium valentinum]
MKRVAGGQDRVAALFHFADDGLEDGICGVFPKSIQIFLPGGNTAGSGGRAVTDMGGFDDIGN